MNDKHIVISKDLLDEVCGIIETSRKKAYRAVDNALIERNWLLGKRLAEEEIREERAAYGAEVIRSLSKELTRQYGKGFTKTNLYSYYRFYKMFPDIFHSLSGKSSVLSWTHYRSLLSVEDEKARRWYEQEAISQTWSVRTLQRNIETQYYYRLLSTQGMMEEKSFPDAQRDKREYLKNPVIAEFLGPRPDLSLSETDLETAILSNLQVFLMEMGKGYAFVERQEHIHTEKRDYYIDLVFYNYILKCFVLVDLKMGKITHQDVGQMDMYVRMYDERKRNTGDNPTLGIILCSETDEDIARYSVMHGSEQLFAS